MDIVNTNYRYISPVGSPEARYVIVSTAPKAVEHATGQGYVNSYAKILDTMLSRAGILRSSCYLTYVIKERPPRDDVGYFIDLSKRAPYITEKYRMYINELKQELEKTNANIIVAVGNVPLYALTGLRSITNWRGSTLDCTLIPGRKVLPIIDTEVANKQYIYMYMIQHDLQKVVEEAKYPEIRKRERVLRVGPSFPEAMEYLEQCKKVPQVGFDIEGGAMGMQCFAVAKHEEDAMCIPLLDSQGDYFTPDKEVEILKSLAELLQNPHQKHVLQNGLFDLDYLYRDYGIRITNIEDSMVAHAITFPDFPKNLGFLTSFYTDMNFYKDEGKKGMIGKVDKSFWLYNARDAVACLEAYHVLQEEIRELQNEKTYSSQVRIIQPLAAIQWRGIRIDKSGIGKANNEALEEIDKLQEELDKLTLEEADVRINMNSPKQLKEYFYERKRSKVYHFKGKPTTNEKAMKHLASDGHKEASIILKMRKLKKLQGTYYDMKFDPLDGRFRTSYDPAGTKNGRLSSSKRLIDGVGGNAQNIPSSFKKYMLADEGYLAFEVDLSQAENRIMAYICPEPKLIRAFENGIDVHRLTASMLFDIPFEEVSDEPGSSPIGNGTRSQRYWGKTSNHAFNYDLSPNGYALRFECSLHEAKRIYNRYHSGYPGVHLYHQWIREELSQNGRKITNLFGRTRRFIGRWEDHLFKEAYNFIPQSTVADIINIFGLSGIYFDPKFKEVELLNQVHDSIVFQIPVKVGLDRMAEILDGIINTLQPKLKWRSFEFTIPAEAKVGYNLKEMKDVTPDTLSNVVESL